MKRIEAILLIGLACLFAGSTLAGTPDEAELVAMRHMGDEMADWIADIEPKPESISIFAINVNAPLTEESARIFETELRKGLSDRSIVKVTTCVECRNPYVSVKDDKVIVSAGVADADTLKQIAGKNTAQTFLIIDLYRTSLRITANAQLMDSASGDILGVERFSVPALSFNDTSAQVIVTFGAGMIMPKTGTSQDLTPAAAISLLEDVGFAKAGLTTGAVISSGSGTLIYVDPTLALRGRFGHSGMGYSLMLAVGYGFVGSTRALNLRSAFDVFWGSWAMFGLDGTYLVTSGSTPTIPGYVGFHVGVAFGR